jgi:hypothetical protein
MILPILFAAPSSIPLVHALGTLFIGPPQQGPFTVGTIFTYQVNVTGMDPFDGWDIYVDTNSSVLKPVSISVAGNMLGSVFEFANCINGAGTGCSINDNAGTAHSAAISNSGIPTSGSGLLFTITYRVVASGYSFLRIPAGLNTLDNSGSAVVHSAVGAVYGAPPLLPVADFTFSPATPTQVDNVTFDATGSSDPAGGSITRYSWQVTALVGGLLDIRASTSQPIWVHKFNSTFEVGDLSVQLIVTDDLGLSSEPRNKIITVTQFTPSDFSIFVSNMLNIHPGHTGTVNLILQGKNNFAGDVNLSVRARFGFSTTLSVNPVILSTTTTSATSVLTIVAHVRPGFSYALTVTASSGALVHSITFYIVVSVPS